MRDKLYNDLMDTLDGYLKSDDDLETLTDKVYELAQPQKVELPKKVASWFGDTVLDYDLVGLLQNFYKKWFDDDILVMDFVDNHCEGLEDAFRKIARAYLDGYEVEKEKLYTVVLPNAHSIPFGYRCYLHRNDEGVVILAIGTFSVREDTKLTEAEIKSLDERYMAFAEEVVE